MSTSTSVLGFEAGVQYYKSGRAYSLLTYAKRHCKEITVMCSESKIITSKVIKFDLDFNLWLQNAVVRNLDDDDDAPPRDPKNMLVMGIDVISVGLLAKDDKVGEIFREAAKAFEKLSEMTLLLHPMGEAQPGGKWTEEEIDMLRSCVHRFTLDLNKLSQHIKNRTVSQICTTLKKKAFEDAGMTLARPVSSSVPTLNMNQSMQPPAQVSAMTPMTVVSTRSVLGKNAEVTLNMLNATENEVDVEGLVADVKLDFENTDDVPN